RRGDRWRPPRQRHDLAGQPAAWRTQRRAHVLRAAAGRRRAGGAGRRRLVAAGRQPRAAGVRLPRARPAAGTWPAGAATVRRACPRRGAGAGRAETLAGHPAGAGGDRARAAAGHRDRPAGAAAGPAARAWRRRRDAGAGRARPRHPAQHPDPRTPSRLCRAMVRAGRGGACDRAAADLEETIQVNAPAPDPAVRRRNRGMLLALFALFFGGMLVAGLLRFSGWRPEGSKSKGELLQPYPDLRTHSPTLADGSAYGWTDSPRTWRIVVMPRDCDGARAAACARLLADLD